METSKRIYAFIAYLLPILGWVYLFIFHRKDGFVKFHLKQAIGIFIFILAVVLCWGVVAWAITWVPYGFMFGMGVFSIVILALCIAFFTWLMGMYNALLGRVAFLPIFGRRANRLPI